VTFAFSFPLFDIYNTPIWGIVTFCLACEDGFVSGKLSGNRAVTAGDSLTNLPLPGEKMNEIETDRDIERFAHTASGDFSFRAYGVRYTWDYSDHCYDRLTFGGFWKAA
jgi:hypothetical protein